MKERDLTCKEIKRQDFVDNKILELMNDLLPEEKVFKWDIGAIGEIRDSIRCELIKKGLTTEQEFYPYLESPPHPKYAD